MSNPQICITLADQEKLKKLLDAPDLMRQRPYLETLVTRLESASAVVASEDVPSDVITMNSTAQLIDLDTQEEMVLTLVYPEDADINQGKISVLAPIGMAILGCRKGDTVTWEVPNGTSTLRIKKILYQPEAAGQPG